MRGELWNGSSNKFYFWVHLQGEFDLRQGEHLQKKKPVSIKKANLQ